MPLRQYTDPPDAFRTPLETLARAGNERLTDAEVKVRVETALHEAAHFIAACHCRGACILEVRISPAGNRTRSRILGRVNSALLLASDDAFDAFVGYAWEELHGDVACAANDLHDGNRYADQTELSRDDLLNKARHFVRREDAAIRCAAAGILATMPRSGILKGRELKKLVDRFRSVNPRRVRQANRTCSTWRP